MTIFHDENHHAAPARIDIWRCKDCDNFHIRVGSLLMTFTPEEYTAFLRAAGRCYLGEACAHFTPRDEAVKGAEEAGDSNAGGRHTTPSLVSALEH